MTTWSVALDSAVHIVMIYFMFVDVRITGAPSQRLLARPFVDVYRTQRAS